MKPRSSRRLTALLITSGITTGLLLGGCSNDGSGTADTDSTGNTTASSGGDSSTTESSSNSGTTDSTSEPGGWGGKLPRALVKFDSCDGFLSYLKAEAMERVGPYGLAGMADQWLYEAGFDAVDAASAPGNESARTGDVPTVAPAPGSVSGTNVQEVGVDEADIVKTDGNRIVTLNDKGLTVVDITGGTPVVTGTLALEPSFASEMFLVGDRVILMSNSGHWGEPVPVDNPNARGSAEDQLVDAGPAALITEINLAGANGPEIVSSVTVQGQYLSARQIGSTIRLAINSSPVELPFLFPENPSGEASAEEANKAVIEKSTLDDWLPHYTITGATTQAPTPLLPCDSIQHPAQFSGFDTVSVIDINLDKGVAVPTSAVGVLASGEQVYSSLNRFYVASSQWLPPEVDPADTDRVAAWSEDFKTDVHAFALSDTEPTKYVGSGSVDGSLLNPFSMDESGGYVRVVTTQGSPWGNVDGGGEATSESMLTVLAEQGNQLVQVGKLGGMGKGETLYAARLFDKVGFAVTFKQIDPLYVIDLADPTNPHVTGELKIPGVSTYLHPISDTRILGIGQDATEEGAPTGLKLSLFDVSDPANPKEISVWTMPDASSPVESDHRAFQMVGTTAIIPVQQWSNGAESFNGAVLFDIGDQITEIGRVTNVGSDVAPTSDCRPLDPSVLSPQGQEMVAQQGDVHIQICTSEQVGGWGHDSCNPFAPDELQYMYNDSSSVDADIAALGLVDSDRVEICYPDSSWAESIVRSVVINSTLYTVAADSVVSTDLSTMAPTGRVDF